MALLGALPRGFLQHRVHTGSSDDERVALLGVFIKLCLGKRFYRKKHASNMVLDQLVTFSHIQWRNISSITLCQAKIRSINYAIGFPAPSLKGPAAPVVASL